MRNVVEEVRAECRAEYEGAYAQLSDEAFLEDLTWACIGPLLKAWSKTETVIDDYLAPSPESRS